ncbi:MAG: hypothetical protein ABGY10_05450 [bacterium]|nr:hypothetical protein [Gemmatimonadota bacterium]HIL89265.1 hypothetical protein [Gemmatimonadota bacterium]
MARHNREGRGTDQLGFKYAISYQPDWLKRIKVRRQLKNGRQSTKGLFRNPVRGPEAGSGDRIRAGITSDDQALGFEIALTDPQSAVKSIKVVYVLPGKNDQMDEIEFAFEGISETRK